MNTWKQLDPFRPLDEATNPTDMRAAIERARMHSPIVRQALDSCRMHGMSAEDTYTVLSYYALQALAGAQSRLLNFEVNAPLPMYIPSDQVPR